MLTTKETISVWGCVACSSAWAAAGQRPVALFIAAGWLAFAAIIIYASDRTAKRDRQRDDDGKTPNV